MICTYLLLFKKFSEKCKDTGLAEKSVPLQAK